MGWVMRRGAVGVPSCKCDGPPSAQQFWRLFTCFIFFGNFSLGFLFQMYLLCVVPRCRGTRASVHLIDTGRTRGRWGHCCCSTSYSARLESNPYPSGGGPQMGTIADYMWMLCFGGALMAVRAWWCVCVSV